jgi:anaerobic dimethyl sulfoxide reductase subunit A
MEGSYSFQAANFALPYVYGTGSIGYDAGTLLDTRFVILWGANIADTRFGNESRSVMRHIRSQGGEIVVIDPRRTETSRQLGTQWIPIRPGEMFR